jgi:hypothetical protein
MGATKQMLLEELDRQKGICSGCDAEVDNLDGQPCLCADSDKRHCQACGLHVDSEFCDHH